MNRIKALRTEKRLSQEKLAKIANVHQTAVSQWETEKTTPDRSTLPLLVRYFQVSGDYILGLSDERDIRKTSPEALQIRILGHIPAGIPLEAIEDVIDTEEVPIDWKRGGREYFGLKIRGDSMSPDYPNDAVVIFLVADDCESGDDCAVMVNDEDATFKKVVKQLEGVVLQPINTSGHAPKFYSNADVENLPVRILGIAVESRKKHGRFK